MDRSLASALLLVSGALAWSALTAFYPSTARASVGPSTPLAEIRKDLDQRRSNQFEALLNDWQERYGTEAVSPLLELAADRKRPDPDRYIALMGAAKLGGAQTAPLLVRFLKDPSWMLRSATLRALSALQNPRTAGSVLPSLKDPALVVRLEAVKAVEKLHPAGAESALLAALESRENYHGGKAQWVPQRALGALAALGDRAAVRKLRPLLDHGKDPDLQRETVRTLEALTGQPSAAELTLSQKVRHWKLALQSEKP